MVEILQKFVAFSEYMNFTTQNKTESYNARINLNFNEAAKKKYSQSREQ